MAKAFVKKTKSKFKYTGVKYSEYVIFLKKDPLWSKFENSENVQIDHIIPVSLYDYNNEEDIRKCWQPENLRFLDSIENIKKSNELDINLIKKHNILHLLPEKLKNREETHNDCKNRILRIS